LPSVQVVEKHSPVGSGHSVADAQGMPPPAPPVLPAPPLPPAPPFPPPPLLALVEPLVTDELAEVPPPLPPAPVI
jgi:hypothetical protein